ncbi:MAG: hypothetical protein KC416_11035, partial [Myxococcales bacterium]|nr:hypothetical protein [Myxococcales bacterium]
MASEPPDNDDPSEVGPDGETGRGTDEYSIRNLDKLNVATDKPTAPPLPQPQGDRAAIPDVAPLGLNMPMTLGMDAPVADIPAQEPPTPNSPSKAKWVGVGAAILLLGAGAFAMFDGASDEQVDPGAEEASQTEVTPPPDPNQGKGPGEVTAEEPPEKETDGEEPAETEEEKRRREEEFRAFREAQAKAEEETDEPPPSRSGSHRKSSGRKA